jgi:hypothetical protein
VPLSTTSTATGAIPAARIAARCVPLIDAVHVTQSTRSAPADAAAVNTSRNSPGAGWEVVGTSPEARNRA